MSNTIYSKTLAIAKKQEAERLKGVKERFLKIMEKEFERRVTDCEPWTAIGEQYYIYNKNKIKDFLIKDLKEICKSIGFNIKSGYDSDSCLLSIPERVKGQKMTQAQRMLYRSNIEIKRNIKSRKESAKKSCKEALEKLKNGDFESQKCYNDSYEITVKISYSEDNKEFIEEAKRIFAKKNIALIIIDVKRGEWKLIIRENDK